MQTGRRKRKDVLTESKSTPAPVVRYSYRATALLFFITAGIVLAADLISKALVFAHVQDGVPFTVIPGWLNLHLGRNPGAVFGIGAGMRFFFIFFAFVALGVILWAVRAYGRTSRFLTFGFGLLLGGAMGNLWDRIVHATVRDFIDFYINHWHWHTFNIADVAITTGCAIIILHSFLTPATEKK